MTNYDFTRVFNMPAVEFFAYVAYVNFDTRRQEKRMNEINRKYGK